LSDADLRRRLGGFGRVEDNNLQGMMVWIQEDTERDYDLIEYRKNTLVVADGYDGKIFD
jgi:hypothetical protein